VGLRGWFLLTGGSICLCIGVVLGILAIQQATEISAYHHARACPAGAPSAADCLRVVDGSVVGVAEESGNNGVDVLDVRTASTTLRLNFNSDNAVLGYAVDGDAAAVTLWRGVPVSVMTNGRSGTTTSVPETALAGDLTGSEVVGGMGLFFAVGGVLSRQMRRFGITYGRTRPVAVAVLSALLLGGFAVVIGGGVLAGTPSRIGPDLIATGAALVAVLCLSVWFGIYIKRRAGKAAVSLASAQGVVDGARVLVTPNVPVAPLAPMTRSRMPTRMRPATAARMLSASAAGYVAMLLTVAVLFGVWRTAQDGPTARAFRQAPACIGETNLATCAGDFTAVINGVRAAANGNSGADVSYVTADGAINNWASIGGDTAVVVRQASADEAASTPLRIRVWRRGIVGAELGGRWYWAWNYPPGNTIPTIFLAVSFTLLLLVMRLRIHRRRARSRAGRRIYLEDLGQVAGAAGSILLLAYGFWTGAILAVAVLLWLGLSVRQGMLSFLLLRRQRS